MSKLVTVSQILCFKLAAKLVYHYYIPKMPDNQHESERNRNLLVIKFIEMVRVVFSNVYFVNQYISIHGVSCVM